MDQLTAHDPRRIGPFEVLGRLGAGGMGLVYLARSAAGRRVAIKTVRAELAEDQLFRVRFAREIAAARTVSGFYTAAVVDADADAAVPWLATAYIPAPSLEDLVTEAGPLPVATVRWLIAGIAEALQSIHAANLVHRDLKPSNVLITEDGPRVIDFGIAAGVSHTRLTMTNVAVGTPAYMSPEQARDSRGVKGSSDVFSLGSLTVFAATGHPPYHGANPVETVFMLLREAPDLAGLPEELAPLVRACMRTAPERRPLPEEIAAELAPHLYGSGDGSGDDAGEYLPPAALALIERMKGKRTPPPPPFQPQPPRQPSAGQVPQGGGFPGQGQGQGQGHVHAGGGAGGGGGGAGGGQMQGGPDPYGRHGGSAPLGPVPPVGQPVPPVGQPGQQPGYPGHVAGLPAAEGGPAPVGGRHAAPVPGTPPEAATTARPVVHLPGVAAPIGPGVRLPAHPSSEPVAPPTTGWVRHGGSHAAPGVPAASGAPAVPAVPAPAQPTPSHASAPSAPAVPPERPGPGPVSVPGSVPGSDPGAVPGADTPWRPWRFRMSHDVWGSPVVSDGALYVTSFGVHALDIASGRRRFRTESVAWALAVADGRVHAADGPNLFTLQAADGAERWRVALDGWTYTLDAAGGALVAGTRGGGVHVRSAIDGSEMWQARDAQQAYENPASGPCVIGDSVYYYGGGCLRSVELTTGQPQWALPLGEDVPSRPVLHRGVLLLCSGTRVYAVDEQTGAERWRFDAPVVLFTSPAVSEHGVFVADYLGTVFALDPATGGVRWHARTGGRQGAEPVVVAEDSVLVGSGDTAYAFDARTGAERWRYAARAELAGVPAAADGLVHLGSRDHSLHTLELATGRLRWKLDTGGEITGPPVTADGRVFACSKDHCVYALDAARGTATTRE
ncbi:serine/threonine-protein kinase [Streptacidiphilus jiangxiensis]|uniref:Serine/threonine protein kinase n=1 Tax=Streptacidiphilus jiangxiensis TaxID=235985 RepID=A0A1H7F7X1_STRJI|nr:PQQ-binding-like beta-propeller repeat protein [Streptacidiphilus jiangxiensis]SEK22176.1 Serine/threonine protein kinase [Streptacidiphilus jiangxiensis]